jgi:RNA recognition motif-containing protein
LNIYIGNLALEVTEDELRQEFRTFGEVNTVTIIDDKYIGSGQLRGYGFVEMPSKAQGETAVAALNGKSIRQMSMSVIQALPLSDIRRDGTRIAVKFSGRARHRKILEYLS